MGKKKKEEKKQRKERLRSRTRYVGAFLVAMTWRCCSVFDVLHEYLPLDRHAHAWSYES